LASLTSAYPIYKTQTVNCRASPSTGGQVVRTYRLSDDVKLVCQIEGQAILGNSVWDKTSDGCYVSDYYVKTGSSRFVVAKCGSDSPGTGAPGSQNPPKRPSNPIPPTPSKTQGGCPLVNPSGAELIKSFESWVPTPYGDPDKHLTIGYGHLCTDGSCKNVGYPIPLSKADGESLLEKDVRIATSCLSKLFKSNVRLNQNQWAALGAWVFNLGCPRAQTSSLFPRINNGEDPNTVAADVLPQWRNGDHGPLPGLVRRRNAEVNLFKTPSSKLAFPSCEN
ncbi:hypothetical protein GGI12_005826, partial [Dipsacomyces acuminosporus]